jgi:hypothetical protein
MFFDASNHLCLHTLHTVLLARFTAALAFSDVARYPAQIADL